MAQTRLHVLVYDSLGRFLRAIGGKGNGPGEFGRGISRLRIGIGDTLYVLHHPMISVFDSEYRHVRTVTFPIGTVIDIWPLASGKLLVTGVLRTPDGFARPYHIVSTDSGKVERSFGDPMVNHLMDHPNLKARRDNLPAETFVTADRRGFWLSPSYHLRKWSQDGKELVRVDVIGSPWVPPLVWKDTVATTGRGRDQPRYVRQSGGFSSLIGVDSAERLWLVTSTVARGRPPKSRLEVITAQGSVLLSQPIQNQFRFIGPDLAVEERIDPDGFVSMIVSRITLVRK